MSQRSSAGARRSALLHKHSLDAEEVLEALEALIPQAHSPVVQECLRAARCEIAHLTSTDDAFREEGEEDLENGEDQGAKRMQHRGQHAA